MLFMAAQIQENTEDITEIKEELKIKENRINILESKVKYLEKQLWKNNFENINCEEIE